MASRRSGGRPPRAARRRHRRRRAVLLSVGRLEQNKGFHVLADALAALRDHSAPHRRRPLALGHRRRRPVPAALESRDSRRRHLRRTCMLAGRLADRELHAWYEAARSLRPSDAVRRQLARHARSHGAPARRRRDNRRRAARQGAGRASTAGSCRRATRRRWPRRSAARLANRRGSRRWATPAAQSSSASSRGTAAGAATLRLYDELLR